MSHGTVAVRRAVAGRADAEAATTIARRAKASWPYPPAWLDVWREELTLSPTDFRDHIGHMAELRGVPVGVCLLEAHPGYWELSHLWVDPDAQRRGVGRALLEVVGRYLREHEIGACRIHSDPYAESFYLRLGAQRIGEIPSPMEGAPDRVLPLMEWRVPQASV